MTPPAIAQIAVKSMNARRSGLAEMEISEPVDGGENAAYAVRIRGHILDATGPVEAIEVVTPGAVLAMTRPSLPSPAVAERQPGIPGADSCGFTLLIDTLSLPPQFEFRLRAVRGDGTRIKVASIRGERLPLSTGYAPRLQPLLVTSLGRMGTTLLMRMLAAHPAVVTYARPPYEARGGKYWLHMLKTLAAPADATKRVGAPMEFHLESFAVGGNPFYSAAFDAWPDVEAWSGSDYVADLAAFCQRSIDGWYLATAAAQDQPQEQVQFFAEKHFPDEYPRLMRELYPEARELFLVRDFRDMVASMQSFNARGGFGDFGRVAAADDADWLHDLRRALLALRDAWHERGDTTALVRYEDLVQRPHEALPVALTAVGLETSPEIVEHLIAAASPDVPELRGHGTTASPTASIGRWRQDLSPELQSEAHAAFGDLLRDFGYE